MPLLFLTRLKPKKPLMISTTGFKSECSYTAGLIISGEINKRNFYMIQKRTMQRATNMFHYVGTKLVPPTKLNFIQKRNIPNHGYTFVETKKN
jgi:hypothetical protein